MDVRLSPNGRSIIRFRLLLGGSEEVIRLLITDVTTSRGFRMGVELCSAIDETLFVLSSIERVDCVVVRISVELRLP